MLDTSQDKLILSNTGLSKFNQYFLNNPWLSKTLLPIGAGLGIWDFVSNRSPSSFLSAAAGLTSLFNPLAGTVLGGLSLLGSLLGVGNKPPIISYEGTASAYFDPQYSDQGDLIYFYGPNKGVYAFNSKDSSINKVVNKTADDLKSGNLSNPEFVKVDPNKEFTQINGTNVSFFNPELFMSKMYNDVLYKRPENQERVNNLPSIGDFKYDESSGVFYDNNGRMYGYLDENNNIRSFVEGQRIYKRAGKEPSKEDLYKTENIGFMDEQRNPYMSLGPAQYGKVRMTVPLEVLNNTPSQSIIEEDTNIIRSPVNTNELSVGGRTGLDLDYLVQGDYWSGPPQYDFKDVFEYQKKGDEGYYVTKPGALEEIMNKPSYKEEEIYW